MEDWDANLSPCNFATTHVPAERSRQNTLQLRDHPFDSLQSEFVSPSNFATHETEDPFATPQITSGKNLKGEFYVCFKRSSLSKF